jgi:hypothetical protein
VNDTARKRVAAAMSNLGHMERSSFDIRALRRHSFVVAFSTANSWEPSRGF